MSFTVASVYMDEETLDEYLRPSLNAEVIETIFRKGTPCFNLAAFYNEVWDNAKGQFVVFAHPDMKLSPEVYQRVRTAFDLSDVEVVGLFGKAPCRRNEDDRFMYELDSCFIAVRRDSNFRFDSNTFDGLHQYVEDLCWQVMAAGRRGIAIKVDDLDILHYGKTFEEEEGRWLEQHNQYKILLRQKWASCRFGAVEEKNPLIFIGAEDGTKLLEFEKLLWEFPTARKLILKRGSRVIPTIPDVEVLTCGFDDLNVLPDFPIFPMVGAHNCEDYLRVLKAAIPVVVNKVHNFNNLVDESTGHVYTDVYWARIWLYRCLGGKVDVEAIRRNMKAKFSNLRV